MMNCSGRGVCNLGNCVCVDGYQGKGCQDTVGQSAQRMMSFLEVESTIHAHTLQAAINRPSGSKLHLPQAMVHLQTGSGLKNDVCSGHGTSSGDDCFCDPGFEAKGLEAKNCDQAVVCTNNCNMHGSCALGRCFCDPGYEGSDCAEVVPCLNECSGNGECWNGRCSCHAGYEGVDCSDSKPRGDLNGLTVTEMAIVAVVAFAVGLFLGLVLKAQMDAHKKAKFNQMLQQDVRQPFVSAP